MPVLSQNKKPSIMSILHPVSLFPLVLGVFSLLTPMVDGHTLNIGNDPYILHDEYICPNAEDIAPCECSEEDGLLHKVLDLYCYGLADEQELYDILHSNLPVNTFRELTFDARNIDSLSDDDVFGNATFEEVFFFCKFRLLNM